MSFFSSGTVILWAGVFLSALTAGFGILGYLRKEPRLVGLARQSLFATAAVIVLASLLLWFALLSNRFDLKYVAYNSSLATPFFYKLSAFWGSLDGSLLLWALFLAIFSALFFLRLSPEAFPPLPLALAVPALVLCFFLLTILFTANPFAPLVDEQGNPFVPRDGLGLNPLLQHPAMVLHPPFLYLGFTGFTIPFSLALATLIHDPGEDHWLRLARRSSLIAFGFLSLGILMGSNWAYMELGWGGYWGWDPVENSSLLPWLSGTAFLHSLMVQEYRGLLKGWNFFLIFLTFWLTILGTFLTRSGVVSSVHAFAGGEVGIWFLSFLALSVLGSLALLLYRVPELRRAPALITPVSREGMFLLNNLLFLVLAFSILWGTTYPILYELFTGTKITIGTPYYERVTYPFGIALLLLLGVGPLMPWGRVAFPRMVRRFRIPLFIGTMGLLLTLLLLPPKPQVLVFFTFLSFTGAATLYELLRGLLALKRKEVLSFSKALLFLFTRNGRRYGGYLVHLGVVLIFLGIAGEFFHEEKEFRLNPGEWVRQGDYAFRLERIVSMEQENYLTRTAFVTVVLPEGDPLTMWPEKRVYLDGRNEKTTEVAIASSPLEDRYLVFLEDLPGGAGLFRFHITPLVFWIWAGGAVVLLGVLFTILGRVPSRLEAEEEP